MKKQAQSTDKPSPSDTPTKRPVEKGGKSKVREEDRKYKAKNLPQKNIAKIKEEEEQPVNPIKSTPTK